MYLALFSSFSLAVPTFLFNVYKTKGALLPLVASTQHCQPISWRVLYHYGTLQVIVHEGSRLLVNIPPLLSKGMAQGQA
jgi:hypothetical protein